MRSKEQTHYLGQEKIPKLMLKFSIPCILSLLVSALYNIVDQVFIGNSEMSALGNAATGVVFPIFIIAQAFAWCFGDGCAAYLNICQGKKDTKNATACIGSGITITLLVSLILMAVFFPLKEQILTLFGASENTIGMAVEYFNIILAFFPANMLMNMMNSVIRADGSPAWSMASMLSGAIINIILDPVFIFGFHWGMSGAALATVIGQVVSFVISVIYFFRTKTFRLSAQNFIPHFRVFSAALKLGASSFVTQITIVIISLVCNIMLAKYGALSQYGVDIPIAIIGIESKVFTFVINIVVGIILGCQPIISYNFGAGNYKRVKLTYRYAMTATVIIGLVATLIFELAPRFVVGMFGQPTNVPNPGDYWEFAEMTFRIFLALVVLTCAIKMTSIFFQAVGKPIHAVISSLTRDIICFVPLVIILPRFFGIKGILYAAPIADLIASLVMIAILCALYFDPAKIVWGHRDLLFPTSSRHFDYLSLYAFDRIYETDLIGKYARHAERSGRAVSPSIITISRQFGSGVRQIGAESVDRLNIPFSASPRISLNGRRTGRIGFSPLCIKQAPGAGLCHWMTKSIRLRSGRSKSWRARTPSWAGARTVFWRDTKIC